MSDNSPAFAGRHIGPGTTDTRAMLATLGVPSVETLIAQTVPKSIRLGRPLRLPAAASEAEALAELSAVMSRNTVLKSFIGQGYHGTIVPPVIQRNLFENPAWYTAYTPYQAEISQGRLEMLFNFQTLVTELTGLPVASASLLDEATAVAEAIGIAYRHHREKRGKIALAGTPHPQTLDVARTRAEPLDIEIDGETIDDNTAALLVSWPDTFGMYVDHTAAIAKAKAAGALVVFVSRSAGADANRFARLTRRRHRRRPDAAFRRADGFWRTARGLLRRVGQADPADAGPAGRPVGRCAWPAGLPAGACRPANSTSAATRRPPTSARRRRCWPTWRRPMPYGTARRACRRSPGASIQWPRALPRQPGLPGWWPATPNSSIP